MPNFDVREQLSLGQGFDLKKLASVQYNILPSDFKQTQVQTVEWSDTFFTANESSDEKMKKFGLDASLQVGVLFGLIDTGVDFHFLSINQSKNQTVSGTLMYRYATTQESLVIDQVIPYLEKFKILNEETAATHVITKIIYGGYAICRFDYDLEEGEKLAEIEVTSRQIEHT
ncbi:hypothetical protein BCR33DRAFT_742894 [Rhizoclosmatium globosum]|uniref:Uncharacterized protein n=1 Tax=Rhizoclosmatium globosum TaxID=329046 RepID=A0A1Y2BNT1_9FUNG|nr:hypothetical protein BCR33DRAFT_742894 [Rhizoclosmatium globosum]|eukprot:ORY36392.1 hypothetical protein BCR33DRAFT_742894 [Rhizoclosmatium globosum]